ncbi:M28 family metallopeptidase [Sphingomonas sp.]|uniref:M28 family metallopeptidase n=1 Tax=Sphingomonas sp. TaxID=28214 RepID=UPI002BD2102D|nr:M28 family metallopeptidase [Sphingomonas sp.]HWK34929.1 M28 family metallopeptidase [Sphingomonas sp.]
MKRLIAALLACTATIAVAQDAPTAAFTPEAVRAHVEFLADDLLEGRDIGTRGHEIAARYVASQFDAMGLKPAGDNGGWYQRVTFQKTLPGASPARLTITGAGGSQSWEQGTEVLVAPSPRERALDLSAPLVFVGYGISDAATGIDDYKGVDARGKIVVVLSGFPKGMPSEVGAHLGSSKSQAAQAHGAIGVLTIATLDDAKRRPWDVTKRAGGAPRYGWVGEDGQPFTETPGVRGGGYLNGPAAQAVFADASRTVAQVLAEADKTGGRPKPFALKTSARIEASSTAERITSPNVAAILPGSDPTLASEYVVLSAHLDHIGVTAKKDGEPADTDHINNGALDNAAGIATMLEVARAITQSPDKPKRSIIFVASTGEEKGLLGADYFARHPGVPIDRIVGNVDLDMPLLLYRFTDVTAFGADHSTLGPLVAAAVKPMGVTLSPDPMPQESIFVRSDHYMFVKQGVPAVFLATGFANGGGEQWGKFLSGNYHHPGDDMNQPIDWVAGARFAEANYRITMAMADAAEAPRWYKGDYFGDLFAKDRPKADKGK